MQLMNLPMIGAQVFIEPGQTPEEIEGLFRTLHEHHMRVCRIRMFEKYMRAPEGSPLGTWDFDLFDIAFNAAEKYGVKIMATLFPMTEFTDVGGFKFPRTQTHFEEVGEYIRQVVHHFRNFPALWAWVLINEPGAVTLPDDPFTNEKFAQWKAEQALSVHNHAGYYHFAFDEERFLVAYNTWYLNRIAEEIKMLDPDRHLHVNNHSIFENVAEYDFPAWRKFLTSFGGSAHASWHFGYFERSQYALAMAADCGLVRSGAGEKPWLMTEIQGGNNTYSGFNAMCPTKEEITQWLWTILGSGGKGGVFWTLNSRASGFEAGEWAMLDMQDQPTDRLLAAAEVGKTLESYADFFAHAEPVTSPIHILYTRESLWVEKALQTGGASYEGREIGGVMKSALGYYQAISEIGVSPQFGEIGEFDFTKEDYSGTAIILAHQISIPSQHWDSLRNYVERGGKLIMDGLSAYYDEHAHCIMKHDFPLKELCGANIKEFKLTGNLFDITLTDPQLTLPAHCWQGTLHCETAKPIAFDGEEISACRNHFGKGEVVWLPTLLGMGARLDRTHPLAHWLMGELEACITATPYRFTGHQPGAFMRTLVAGKKAITILVMSGFSPDLSYVVPLQHNRIIRHIYSSAESEYGEIRVLLWDGDHELEPEAGEIEMRASTIQPDED